MQIAPAVTLEAERNFEGRAGRLIYVIYIRAADYRNEQSCAINLKKIQVSPILAITHRRDRFRSTALRAYLNFTINESRSR